MSLSARDDDAIPGLGRTAADIVDRLTAVAVIAHKPAGAA